jgi:hypothetical protein
MLWQTWYHAHEAPAEKAFCSSKALNLGTRWLSSVIGDVTHLRYWKSRGDVNRVHVGRIYDAGNWAVLAETEPIGQVCGAAYYEGWVSVPLKTPFRTKLHAAYVIAIDNMQVFGRTNHVFTYPPNKCVAVAGCHGCAYTRSTFYIMRQCLTCSRSDVTPCPGASWRPSVTSWSTTAPRAMTPAMPRSTTPTLLTTSWTVSRCLLAP